MITNLRQHIDLEMNKPLTDREWEHIQNSGAIKRLMRGEIEPAGIAAEICQQREIYSPAVGADAASHRPREVQTNQIKDRAREARAELLSYLVSQLAAATDAVAAFRREILGDALLSPDAVERWIQDQSKREGFTAWLEVPYSFDAG